VDAERLDQIRESLRALGLGTAAIAHELDLVVKDAEQANEDAGQAAAIANQLLLKQRGSGE
jgi:hypothetical protein